MKKTKIAIIGATGNMGSGISKNLAKGNYQLILFGDNRDKISALVDDIKANSPSADLKTAGSPDYPALDADVIIIAIPYQADKKVAEQIKEVANGRIVVSITLPLNEKYDGFLTSPDTSGAEELQKLLPGSKVVKAFNTAMAGTFANTTIGGSRMDMFIAGDDEEAAKQVAEIVKTAGFNPLIAGSLYWSRTLENMQLMLMFLSNRYNYNYMAGWKILHD